jgi:PTH1 family peptidyl-tRNA hydrolase
MKAVVGLGNPGLAYRATRHNVGFMALDELANRLSIRLSRRSLRSVLGEGVCDGTAVVLAKPQTFMNLSGEAMSAIVQRYGIAPADVLVLCDDVNLPLGRVRVRASGSAGGHNGLRSIIASLHTEGFPRVRMGVGRPEGGDVIDHVLSRFERDEQPVVTEMVNRAADAALTWLLEGVEAAMNRFNAANRSSKPTE